MDLTTEPWGCQLGYVGLQWDTEKSTALHALQSECLTCEKLQLKTSGETLKLLAVSVPSTKEQNSQETNSSFPADDSPSALGPFFRFDFDDPLRRKRDGDDGPVAPNV